jgi:hypothetical protein
VRGRKRRLGRGLCVGDGGGASVCHALRLEPRPHPHKRAHLRWADDSCGKQA